MYCLLYNNFITNCFPVPYLLKLFCILTSKKFIIRNKTIYKINFNLVQKQCFNKVWQWSECIEYQTSNPLVPGSDGIDYLFSQVWRVWNYFMLL